MAVFLKHLSICQIWVNDRDGLFVHTSTMCRDCLWHDCSPKKLETCLLIIKITAPPPRINSNFKIISTMIVRMLHYIKVLNMVPAFCALLVAGTECTEGIRETKTRTNFNKTPKKYS